MTDWEIDWEFKYEALRDSIRAACEGIGCHNAHELRQALDAQGEAVSALADVAKVVKERLDWWDAATGDPNCIFYQCEDDKDIAKMRAAMAKLNSVARAAMEAKP